MKALKNNHLYDQYDTVCKEFNKIIESKLDGYDGKKKEQFKSFAEDLQQGGCISGMIGNFIYNNDCKNFYIEYIDELEGMKEDFENELGESIKNRHSVPHYTFMCWLCFEEYVFNIYNSL